MIKLGDQWIKNDRMYKAVSPNHPVSCQGCSNWKREGFIFCQIGAKIDVGCGYGKTYIIKDLGHVNEDGCLAEERTGKFPYVELSNYYTEKPWRVFIVSETVHVTCAGDTKQEAIDAWNRRNV